MKVNVRYGVDTHTQESLNPPTIQNLKNSDTLKAILGFGDNVRALIEGVEQTGETLVPDGATVVFETKCNTKAN